MGRKPSKSGQLVAVSIDGQGAAWCDGQFSGDPAILAFARRAAAINMECPINGQYLNADSETALGAAVALLGFNPGRAKLTQAPADVEAIIGAGMAWDRPEKWDSEAAHV